MSNQLINWIDAIPENLSTKAEQLEWRRSKVIELRSRGLSYGEIANELQVSKACY
jgi:DNA-binding NarL/FixJ family response regulator